MSRYQAVRQGNIHVGVRNNDENIVWHLTDENGKIKIDCEEDNGSWSVDPRWTQKGSNQEVKKRADYLYQEIKKANNNGKVIPYHASGDNIQGLNCENLVGFVLEGNGNPKMGQIISHFQNKYGLDLSKILKSSRSFSSK